MLKILIVLVADIVHTEAVALACAAVEALVALGRLLMAAYLT